MLTRKRFIMRLRQLRAERGITQEVLARKARLSRVYVARLETGKQDPTLTTLTKLAKALKVKVGRLVE
jgi:transcriptional regulator with XRE-family HTH domain